MFRNDVIAAINQDISANGVGAIDGPAMNTILMDIVALIPDAFYKFPATSQLNGGSDVGKLVMNNGGYAVVTMETGGSLGQAGTWRISPVGGAVQYVPATKSSPRVVAVNYSSVMLPADGDTFVISLSAGVHFTFTFRNTPANPLEVGLDPMGWVIAGNLVNAINAYPALTAQGITASKDDPTFTIWVSGPDLSLGVSYTSAFLVSNSIFKPGSAGTTGIAYPYIHNVLMSLRLCFLDNKGIDQEVYSYLLFSDVFAAGAPSGTLGTDGYKYPSNKTEFADNLRWALQNNLQVLSSTATIPFTTFFTISQQGDNVMLTQNFITNSADLMVNYEPNAPANLTVIYAPEAVAEGFVQNPVLGVLTGVDSNHMALIDNRDVIKVKLAQDVRFQVNDPSKDSFYGNIFYRLLKPVDNGQVAPIFPDSKMDNRVEELGTGGLGQSPAPYYISPYSGQTGGTPGFENIDLLRVNSTVLYEALEEGNAGEMIYVRRFSFLLPPGATFPVREDYYGNYYSGYYGYHY